MIIPCQLCSIPIDGLERLLYYRRDNRFDIPTASIVEYNWYVACGDCAQNDESLPRWQPFCGFPDDYVKFKELVDEDKPYAIWNVNKTFDWSKAYDKWKKVHLPARYKYLITFTRDPNKQIVAKWIERVRFELGRKFIQSFKATMEHVDTNIHIHALIESNKYLKKDDFKCFINNYGNIDLKKVVSNNGIEQYLSKENDMILSLEDLKI